MPLPFDPEIVLARPLMATLGTVALDGTPRTAPVWYHWEENILYMLGGADNASTNRIQTHPRISVEITDYDNKSGKLLHVGLRGTAEIRGMDTALFERLLHRYLGARQDWNPWFVDNVAHIHDPDGRLICLKPDSMFTNNVSFFRTGPDVISP